MNRPRSHIQSDLSEAYFRAVVAHAGFAAFQTSSNADYGVDFTVRAIVKYSSSFVDTTPVFDVQVKSHSCPAPTKGFISYPLEVDAYKKLVAKGAIPKVLVVFFLPKNYESWLGCDESVLSLRRAAYWFKASALPPLENQKRTVTISIPRKNLLTAESIRVLAKPILGELGVI